MRLEGERFTVRRRNRVSQRSTFVLSGSRPMLPLENPSVPTTSPGIANSIRCYAEGRSHVSTQPSGSRAHGAHEQLVGRRRLEIGARGQADRPDRVGCVNGERGQGAVLQVGGDNAEGDDPDGVAVAREGAAKSLDTVSIRSGRSPTPWRISRRSTLGRMIASSLGRITV